MNVFPLFCRLDYNNISETGCADLISALHLNPSNWKELDMSGNQLRDTGIEKISTLLKNSQCQLEKLTFVFSFKKISACKYENVYVSLTIFFVI